MNRLWNYRITIKGHLTDDWSNWFDGIQISRLADGKTQLTSSESDQAALYAILLKVQQLGLELIEIERIMAGNEK